MRRCTSCSKDEWWHSGGRSFFLHSGQCCYWPPVVYFMSKRLRLQYAVLSFSDCCPSWVPLAKWTPSGWSLLWSDSWTDGQTEGVQSSKMPTGAVGQKSPTAADSGFSWVAERRDFLPWLWNPGWDPPLKAPSNQRVMMAPGGWSIT